MADGALTIGAVTIESISDGETHYDPAALWNMLGGPGRGHASDDWLPHVEHLGPDGRVTMAMGGFLLSIGDRRILVDAGIGPEPIGEVRGGRLLDSLRAAGYDPSDITDVVFTHLHADHIGWASVAGRPVFDRATYRCDRADWDHFVGADPRTTSMLAPIADRFELWDGDASLAAGLDLLAVPGHTPGSTMLVASAATGERAVLLGDVVHCPMELFDTEWAGLGDVDPVMARRTRERLAAELDDGRTHVAAAHFPGLRFGRLVSGAGRRSWTW